MKIIGISINHKNCDIQIREALYLNDDEKKEAILRLKDGILREGLIASTCNRTEIFGVAENSDFKPSELYKILAELKPGVSFKNENCDFFSGKEAVKHILGVACGIESLVIGDSQILGQIKSAFKFADQNDFLGLIFKRLQLIALKTGKRSIVETQIGLGAVSISFAAIRVIEKIFSNLESKKALVIGAGDTGELTAVHLHDKAVKRLFITNRTAKKGKTVADKVNAQFIPFDNFKEELHTFDVIISATSSSGYILNFDDVNSALKQRKGRSIVLMDIAVPRDIDPDVKNLDAVFYQNVDSLKIIVEQNLAKRNAEIPKVNSIINEEMDIFYKWFDSLSIVPTIKMFRNFFEEIRKDEFNKIKHKLCDDEQDKVEQMTKRLIGRIMHNPTIILKNEAVNNSNYENSANYSEAIRSLFDLNNEEGAA